MVAMVLLMRFALLSFVPVLVELEGAHHEKRDEQSDQQRLHDSGAMVR